MSNRIAPGARRVWASCSASGSSAGAGTSTSTALIVIPVINEVGAIGRKSMAARSTTTCAKGPPKHLYLPGPHRGVWNRGRRSPREKEVILCEALIDALSFWCAGYRNVTAELWGQGFTEIISAPSSATASSGCSMAYDARRGRQ